MIIPKYAFKSGLWMIKLCEQVRMESVTESTSEIELFNFTFSSFHGTN